MKKRGFTLLLCLAILAALILPAAAEQQTGFLHPFVRTDSSYLYLAGAPLNGGSVSVTANGQNVDCTVTTVKDASFGVTYYCVVDQSSSLSNSQRDHQKRALNAVSSALRTTDSMVLMTMGESLVCGEPLTTPEARQQAITKACDYQARFTDLNSSLVSVVQQVTADRKNDSLSCIVLITDGLDDAHVAVSQESLYQTIQSSGISLCTLSLVDPWADTYSWYHARLIREYAAQSVGGISVIPSENYDSSSCVEDAVEKIVEAILSGSVLQLPLDRLPGIENGLELEVTWSKDGDRIAEKLRADKGGLLAATQSEPSAAAQPETQPAEAPAAETIASEATIPEATILETTIPETVPATQPESGSVIPWQTAPTQAAPEPSAAATVPATPPAVDDSLGNMILCLVLAGFVLVVLLVVLAIVLWRKQRALEQEPETDYMSAGSSLVMPEPEEDWTLPALSDIKRQLESGKEPVRRADPPAAEPYTAPGCRVRLVPENHPEGFTEFIIGVNESVTLGRSNKSDIVLNETDRALSGLHFELQWDSRTLYLRDRRSTNGTALNGVPLRPEFWTRVEKRAVIQAGSTRYTVVTEKK